MSIVYNLAIFMDVFHADKVYYINYLFIIIIKINGVH